jgi:hypothetical protein
MTIELKEIPGLDDVSQTEWKVRALAIDNVSPALSALHEWAEKENTDYRKIMKVVHLVGANKRVPNPNHVKKSENSEHGAVYEMRAHRGHARLMFFYSQKDGCAVAVCTNEYWKGKGNQNNAFAKCAQFKKLYESQP